MDYLISTNIYIVFGTVEILHVPKMPYTTTKHEDTQKKASEPDLEAQIDEEMFEETEEAMDKDLTTTEEVMIYIVV